MLNKKLLICIFCLWPSLGFCQFNDGLGQTIQITTRFRSFTGMPSWLLIVRDVDHNQNIPYLFDFRRGNNFWLAITYSRNYEIAVSNMQFSPYCLNPARCSKRISNFCHLETHGRIIRGRSLRVIIEGDLTPRPYTFRCRIFELPEANFTIVSPETVGFTFT